MPYDLSEHGHRFAVWAAARAAQRGFTTVENLRDALQSTGIRNAVANPESLELRLSGFEALHRQWCSSICSALRHRRIPSGTYGRAAKLVAVYLKATVIMGDGANSPLGLSMHPPIDRTLLHTLAACARIESPHKSEWRNTNWTRLNEQGYYRLIAQLREVVPDSQPFWMLEQYWNMTEDEE